MSQENVEPKWYVVHTYSGYENKVKTDLEKTIKNRELEDFFFEIIVPMEEQIEIKDGKKKTNLKKVFPGYVLIKMIVTEESWYIVRNTRGVTGFVGPGSKPVPLSEAEMKALSFDGTEKIHVDVAEGDMGKVIGKKGKIHEKSCLKSQDSSDTFPTRRRLLLRNAGRNRNIFGKQ